MRRLGWRLSSGIALAATILAAGCASGGAETPSPTPEQSTGAPTSTGLNISIINDHASSGTFTLFIEQVGGVRQPLGTVRDATSPKFTFAAQPGVSYILVEQPEAGSTRTSDRFVYTVPTTVTWDINTHRLTVQRK